MGKEKKAKVVSLAEYKNEKNGKEALFEKLLQKVSEDERENYRENPYLRITFIYANLTDEKKKEFSNDLYNRVMKKDINKRGDDFVKILGVLREDLDEVSKYACTLLYGG